MAVLLSTSMSAHSEQSVPLAESNTSEPVSLGNSPVTVALKPASQSLNGREESRGQIYLILQSLRVTEPTDIGYELYFDLPPGVKAESNGPHYVSDFTFFDAESGRLSAAFNITELVAALRSSGRLSHQPTVTIVPKARVASAAPTIGKIILTAVSN
jgi:hypothetical protein